MEKNNREIVIKNIQDKIYNIRSQQVMLDRDLASLYNVSTKVLNQAVKRNIERFPIEFMFQMTKQELTDWKSQFVTSNKENMGLRKKPYVFTEQGVLMLSSILKSSVAIQISIKIVKVFVEMKKFLNQNAQIFSRLNNLELQQIKTNKKIHQVFRALENKNVQPKQGIFYNGQIFEAHVLVSKIIKSAQKEIILIDNFIDEQVLELFGKSKPKVKIIIYTKRITKTLQQDLEKFNQQYQNKKIIIKKFQKAHDRFLIIDQEIIYHIGASLKDLGKKWFAFSKLKIEAKEIIKKLK